MPANHEPAELSLLETLAAAPDEAIADGYVEAAALTLYAHDLLTEPSELAIRFDDGVPRCDELARALFAAYGRGLVERSGLSWRLADGGRTALEGVGVEPTTEARVILAETLEMPATEVLVEVAESLSSRYAMIAAGNGQPVRV